MKKMFSLSSLSPGAYVWNNDHDNLRVSKVWSKHLMGRGWSPETLWGELWGQNYFHNSTKTLFAFSLSIFYVCTVEFSRGCVMCDIAYYNAEADMRIQLSMKPDIKEICKLVKQCHPSVLFWKYTYISYKCFVYMSWGYYCFKANK